MGGSGHIILKNPGCVKKCRIFSAYTAPMIYRNQKYFPALPSLLLNFSKFIDGFPAFCYIVLSDRVTETCEARNRGRTCGSLPFQTSDRSNMTHPKTFSTFSEQISWLQNEKHIIITDKEFAENTLKQIGYFPLMGGYKHLFRVPLTKQYKEGTAFEEITALYQFDSSLRELFFKYLLQIERHLRSLMSYYFSEKYGESQAAYLNINNFNLNRRTHNTASRLIATLQRAVSSTDYIYINYYRTTYRNVPLWVLLNVLTFGNLSKMYQVFPQSLQSNVCKNFGSINRKEMKQFLSVLTKFRNVCAHGERLFTYRTMDHISDLPLHKKLCIRINGTQYRYGKNDLFAVVIAFYYLIPEKDFLLFKRKLSRLLNNISKELNHLDSHELLERMGFPENWQNITHCQQPALKNI